MGIEDIKQNNIEGTINELVLKGFVNRFKDKSISITATGYQEYIKNSY